MPENTVQIDAKTTVCKQRPWLVPFKPGQSGNPAGRPKGSRHKLGEAFIEAMQVDFDLHGSAVIEKVRTENPSQYLKVIASILPKELNVRSDSLSEMDEDELAAVLDGVRALLVAGAIDAVGTRDDAAAESKPSQALRAIRQAD